MPFEEHDYFDTPDDNTPIHKYMDFYKFSSLINTSKLFFCRVTKFSDPMEGCYPRKLYNLSVNDWKEIYKKNNSLGNKSLEMVADTTWKTLRLAYKERFKYAVCAFCSEKHEYEALWKLYANLNTGICIKTTVAKLKKALEMNIDRSIFIGSVQYISEDEKSWGSKNLLGNVFWPYTTKRQEYKIEHEVRALLWEDSNYKNNGIKKFDSEKGVFLEVNLPDLLKEVILSPRSDIHFKDLVLALLKNCNLGVEVKVGKSSLFDKPIN